MKIINLILLSIIFAVSYSPSLLTAKIRLLTFHYNRPDFIEVQHKMLQKFLLEKNDYELFVFNDAVNENLKIEIEQTCQKLGITCINFPQELHYTTDFNGVVAGNGSVRHCRIVQYALENYGYNHDDIIGIIEGDLFLIREFSIRDQLKNYDLVGAIQTDRDDRGYEYIWIGLSFFDPTKLPNKRMLNFDLTWIDNVFLDSGGSTYYYLQNNPKVPIQKYYRLPIDTLPREDEEKLRNRGFTPQEICFLKQMAYYEPEHPFVSTEFHLDKHFIHYAFSRTSSTSQKKAQIFQDFFNGILGNTDEIIYLKG